MLIIWDFLNTLYDGKTGVLYPAATGLLEKYNDAGYDQVLASTVSEDEREQRMKLIRSFGLESYFRKILLGVKNEAKFKQLCAEFTVPCGEVYVVGDNLNNEIRVGKKLGMKTIWVQRKEVSRLRQHLYEESYWRAVKSLREVGDLIEE